MRWGLTYAISTALGNFLERIWHIQAKPHLTKFRIPYAHVALEKIINHLDGLLFIFTGLMGRKEEEIQERNDLGLRHSAFFHITMATWSVTHHFLNGCRSFWAQTQSFFPTDHFALTGFWRSCPLTNHVSMEMHKQTWIKFLCNYKFPQVKKTLRINWWSNHITTCSGINSINDHTAHRGQNCLKPILSKINAS